MWRWIIANNKRGTVNLRKLEQFVAVAEELHFHRAAARLNISQPPLTSAIRRLEEDLGVTLIERGNRVLGLTPAGQSFLIEAREILHQMDRAIATARDTAAGRVGVVKLGYVGSALYGRLPDVIYSFRAAHPDVRLEMREMTTAMQTKALQSGDLDVGILIPPLPSAEDLELSAFDRDRLCLALPKKHLLRKKQNLSLADLAEEPFVLWPMVEGRGFYLLVIRLCADAGFVPKIAQEAHGIHAVLSLVAVGAGVSVVPESMSSFCTDRIDYRPLQGTEASFALNLAFYEPSATTKAFISSAMNESY